MVTQQRETNVERRGSDRLLFIKSPSCSLWDEEAEECCGTLENISRTGLSMVSQLMPTAGEVLSIGIPNCHSQLRYIKQMRVIRIDRYSDGRWHSGLRFLHALTLNELACMAGEKAITMNDMAQQTRTETALLKHHSSGLRDTLTWKVEDGNFARKQSTLGFILRSFQYHLNRLMALEERDGHMDVVPATDPKLDHSVEVLKREHEAFRAESRRIVHKLDHLLSVDLPTFDTTCDDLQALLKKLDKHDAKEADLFHEVFEGVGAERDDAAAAATCLARFEP